MSELKKEELLEEVKELFDFYMEMTLSFLDRDGEDKLKQAYKQIKALIQESGVTKRADKLGGEDILEWIDDLIVDAGVDKPYKMDEKEKQIYRKILDIIEYYFTGGRVVKELIQESASKDWDNAREEYSGKREDE